MSAPRFARYLTETGGDRDRALSWYEWNIRLGNALMRDIAHFEVALRNAYDQALIARSPAGAPHWLFDPASAPLAPLWRTRNHRRRDVNTPNREAVAAAIQRCGGPTAPPGAVIAELSFGFWRHLADAAHEQTVWMPFVYYAWPQGTARQHVDRITMAVNTIRNRASHHEPLFGLGHRLTRTHADMLDLLDLLLPDLAAYARSTSTVATVLTERP
jgi:hypothetical protein